MLWIPSHHDGKEAKSIFKHLKWPEEEVEEEAESPPKMLIYRLRIATWGRFAFGHPNVP